MTRVLLLFVLACIGVAQLRIERITVTCCCPNPAACKCPDHAHTGSSKHAQLRACHRSTEIAAAADAPIFEPPRTLVIAPTVQVAIVTPVALPSPLAPPDRRRPSGPS